MNDKKIFKIVGVWASKAITINGESLGPSKSQAIRNHSPNGFNWGYSGSGPSQLSLAICLEAMDEQHAMQVYHTFKEEVIAKQKQDADFSIEVDMQAYIDMAQKRLDGQNE